MIWVQSSAPGREKSPRSSIPLWGDLGSKMCKKSAAKTRGLEIVHVQISGYFMVFIMFYRLFPSQELHSAISWCVHPACWDKESGTQHDTSQKKNTILYPSVQHFKSCKSARNQDGWPVASPPRFCLETTSHGPYKSEPSGDPWWSVEKSNSSAAPARLMRVFFLWRSSLLSCPARDIVLGCELDTYILYIYIYIIYNIILYVIKKKKKIYIYIL